jgi:hypothetical protein
MSWREDIKVVDTPSGPKLSRIDPVALAEAKAEYISLNAWRGDAWLETHPYGGQAHSDADDNPVRAAEARNARKSLFAWRT